MDTNLRPSGIEGFGDVDWGNHFCLFYETKRDLLDILIPYLKAGLENNEFFLCVASPLLSTDEARQAMREALPDFEQYVAKGQIEIVPYQDWPLTGGRLDAQRVLQNWMAKLNRALAKGYAGLRFIGDPSWLDKQAWGDVSEFEKQLDQIVSNSQMLGLCAYALERCSMADVLDVVHHHQFTVVKTNGFWERLEGSELRRAHDEIWQLNATLEGRVAKRTAELAGANEQLRMKITERARAEEALRESEEKFSAAFRASPIALVIATLDGKYVEMNQSFCELLGYSREELLGKTAVEIGIFNAETRQEWAKAVERAGGVMTNVEFNFRLRNGISRTTLFSAETITFHGVPHRLTTILDITERKRSEQALQESEQRYHTLVDQIPAIVYIDDVSKYPGTTMFVNSYIKTALGFTPEEWFNGGYDLWCNCIHPEDRVQVLSEYQNCMQSGQPFDCEYRMIARDGRLVWLHDYSTLWTDEEGHPLSMHGIAHDITERKQAEEAFRLSEQRFQLLTETIPILVWSARADGVSDYYNAPFLQYLGRTLEEMHGWAWVNTLHPDDRERSSVVWTQAFNSGSDYEIEYRIRRAADGQYRWHLGRALPLRDSSGTIVRWYGTCTDIDDRKQAEAERERLFHELSQSHEQLKTLSSRLAEIQESERRQLALELHDEFGQSLTALKMDLAWLHDHLPPRSKSLREKMDSALDLTNEIIQMTQRLASQLRPRMLDDLGLAAALEWHVSEWSKRTRIKAKITLPEEEWQLNPSLDTALYRVCQETLTNVARHAGASKVEASLAREGDEVVLTVRDNGWGMDRAKITAPESLGLLGMKERVEQIRGRFEIQSEAGKGTTVIARVPISKPLLNPLSHPAPKERGQAGKKPKLKGSRRRKS